VQAFAAMMGGANPAMLGDALGTVLRCLQLNAQQVSSMPLRVHGNAPAPAWIGNPDPEVYTSLVEAVFSAVWSRYHDGNAYLYVTDRYATGYPRTWIVLDPAYMTVEYDEYLEARYTWYGYAIDRADLLHVKRDPRPGALVGTPALQGYWSNLSSAWASESYAADAFATGGVPTTALKYKRKLTGKQAADLQAQWIAAVSARAGAPPVLDDDLDLTTLSFSPRDMMLLELREFDAKTLAGAFGVPAFLLNLPQAGGLNYSNPEMLFQTWWTTELYPCSKQIDTALSSWLPAGSWVTFDPQAMLRPDPVQLSTMWLAALNAGAVSVDEYRDVVLGLPPMGETDTATAAAALEPPAAQAPSQPVTLEVVSNAASD
jgi:HK97 family phage portal protein